MTESPKISLITDSHAGGGDVYVLRNAAGMRVELTCHGAGIKSIRVPAPRGSIETVLGYKTAAEYREDCWYMGSTLGRYANRLENARILIDGETFALSETSGQLGHCLHGGDVGFSGRIWEAEKNPELNQVRFTLVSEDGDQGFPGQVSATVTYTLFDDLKLTIGFAATCDALTVVNLANHSYFNLNSDDAPADNHLVYVNADRFTPIRENLIPTGELRDVADSPFDFRGYRDVKQQLQSHDRQLAFGGGFDHNFVLNRAPGKSFLAAGLKSPESGLGLKLYTTQPGLQLYTGQYLSDPFQPFQGICLEAQNFPNAPNEPGFPDTVLRPGNQYQHLQMLEYSMPTD